MLNHGHKGQTANYFSGFTQVYGSMNSGRKIPLDELRKVLKPGDLLLATGQHILIYVGNDEIIHCTGHGPGSKRGGDKGYGIVRENLADYSAGFESVGRIVASAAESVNSADATTVFKGSGGITNKWSDSASSLSSESTQNGRIVDVEDKLPLYKHILLTEKYNFNNIKWKRYGHGYDGQDCSMKEELNLGLKYPSDEANTDLNAFIDFSLPYLQTWMIPLSMNAGALTQGTQSNTINNPMFPYLTIKKAMSKIIVNRYDITTCKLTTVYRDYDVYKVTEVYNVEYNEKGERRVTSKAESECKKDKVEHKSEPEQDVSTKIDVEPSYYIKQALVFDRKINNKFNYIRYNDDDVKNKIEDGIGYIGKELRIGEVIDEKGESTNYESDGKLYVTYQKREGNYIYVDRTWKDELEVSDPVCEAYDVQDVKDYNLKDEDSESDSVVTDSNGTNQTVPYGNKTITYSAKFASQTKSPEELDLKFDRYEGGNTTVYDGCVVCNENTDEIGASGIKLIPGRKIVAKHTSSSAFELGDWVYIPGWGYALVADTGGFGNANDPYHLDCYVGMEGDMITDGASHGGATSEMCLNQKNMPASGIKVYDRKPGSLDNVTIYRIKAEDIPQELLGDINISDNNQGDNDNNSENEVKNSNELSPTDLDYYKILKLDNEINRVDIMNSKPKNYLEYIKKGTEYSEHVGYSRTYITFAYSNLRRLFDEYFGGKGTVPFAYGTTLGYNIYTGVNEIKIGSYSLSNGDYQGITIPGAVNVPDGLGKVHTWTIWNHVNEQYNPESTWPKGSAQANLILHLTNNNERSLHGELSGNITANSKRMVCYGEWLASAMVSQLGGTQGNPEKSLHVGDLVFIIQDNGTVYPVILTDTKVQFNSTAWDSNPANEWGHDNGQSMVEFQGHTSSWRNVPKTPEEFNHYIKQVYVVGNIYSNPEYLNDIEKAAKDVGIDTSKLINPKKM